MKARLIVALAAVAAVAGWVLLGARSSGPAETQAAAATMSPALRLAPRSGPRTRQGNMDVTFLVTSDTHFGYQVPADPSGAPARGLDDARGIERTHLRGIAAMNGIADKPWPQAIGGTVGKPLGVLVSGDLTEDGKPQEWARFEAYFGLTGNDGMLRHPVFEGIGNHDKHYGWYVKDQVKRRHGAQIYSWDWQDLHLVCLGEAPDHDDLAWLAGDLAASGKELGVVLYFHFPLKGPFSSGHWFGRGNYREALARTLAGYPVLGIFHGHFHGSGSYRWEGYDIYNVGSAKHGYHSFAAVHVRDDRMTVASYNYDRDGFWWWHDKPIFGAAGTERRWTQPGAGLVSGDGWPH
jgi:cytolysin (calcineurin-like family phosphatase)